MSVIADLRILARLARGKRATGSARDRLEAFYAPQADDYDRFRERLLHGRAGLIARLPAPIGGRLVELGGGTGRNLEFFGERLRAFARVDVVDLCPALLGRAAQRSARLGWHHVRAVEADATTWQPDRPADVVLISYALSMIDDWRGAVDNAVAILRPGGVLGVVDFFVSDPVPEPGRVRHGAFTRWFWPRWFGHDGVRLHPEHVPHLRARTRFRSLIESSGVVPYLPGLRAPWYAFVGERG